MCCDRGFICAVQWAVLCQRRNVNELIHPANLLWATSTGVNPAGDAGDTSPQYFGWGDVNGNIPPILLCTFGYSRPILVPLRSLSLKPISFGYKTPPIRLSQSADKARPPNLELALTPLATSGQSSCLSSDMLSDVYE